MAEAIGVNQQIVLSVRIKGDAGPQTGDVVLGAASFGNYDPTLTYEENEVVVIDGALYRAKKTMNPGEFNPDDWEPLTDIIARLPDFEPHHEYHKDEIILVEENLYRAKDDFTSMSAFDPEDWEGIDTVDVCIRDFAATSNYDKDEVIIRNNKLYRANRSFRSTSTWKTEDWDLIGDLTIDDFQINFDYKKNNMVIVSGSIYRARQDFTSTTSFDENDWEKIGNIGIGDFSADTYYSKGSLISHHNKLYISKADFTSGNAFNSADWEIQADVTADDFASNTLYPKNHMVFYDGAIYRAKKEFTSDIAWDDADWELLCPMKVMDFTERTNYYKNQLINYDGSLWRANKAFISSTYFDPFDWEKLGANTMQTTYANSSNDFTAVTEVRPTEVTFEERLNAYQSDSHIKNFTDNQSGRETLITGVDLDQTSSALLTAQRTGINYETADLKVTNIDAYAKLGLQQDGSDPYALFELEDNLGEYFKMQVKQDECKVEMTDQVQEAFTASMGKMSDTTRGLAKTDGRTTRIGLNDDINAYPIVDRYAAITKYYEGQLSRVGNVLYMAKEDFTSEIDFDPTQWTLVQHNPDGDSIRLTDPDEAVIAAYPIVYTWAANTEYREGELVRYQDNLFTAKSSMTSGDNFDLNNWNPIRYTITDYTSGKVYLKGDLVLASGSIYRATQDMVADENLDPTKWKNIAPQANEIDYNPANNRIITGTDAQTAIQQLDEELGFKTANRINNLIERADSTDAAQAAQDSKIANLESKTTATDDRLTKSNEEIEKLQQQLQAANNTIAELQAENQDLDDRLVQLRKYYTDLEARVTALEEQSS